MDSKLKSVIIALILLSNLMIAQNSNETMAVQNIKGKQLEFLIKKEKPILDKDMATLFLKEKIGYNPYILKDGRILLISPFDKTGVIYPNKKKVLEVLSLPELNEPPSHILKGMIKDEGDFTQKLSVIEVDICKTFNADIKRLDASIKSLEYLDSLILQTKLKYSHNNDFVLPLTLYLGKVFLKNNSKAIGWELVRDNINETWEPYVYDNRKVRHNFWLPITKSIIETSGVSLVGILNYEMRNR